MYPMKPTPTMPMRTMRGSLERVNDETEAGQQARGGIGAAGRHVDGILPAFAAAAVDAKADHPASSVGDPIFADGWHLLVEFDVADQVLFGVIRRQDFDDENRTYKVPAELPEP